jgi:hypothetical protein
MTLPGRLAVFAVVVGLVVLASYKVAQPSPGGLDGVGCDTGEGPVDIDIGIRPIVNSPPSRLHIDVSARVRAASRTAAAWRRAQPDQDSGNRALACLVGQAGWVPQRIWVDSTAKGRTRLRSVVDVYRLPVIIGPLMVRSGRTGLMITPASDSCDADSTGGTPAVCVTGTQVDITLAIDEGAVEVTRPPPREEAESDDGVHSLSWRYRVDETPAPRRVKVGLPLPQALSLHMPGVLDVANFNFYIVVNQLGGIVVLFVLAISTRSWSAGQSLSLTRRSWWAWRRSSYFCLDLRCR